MVALGEQPEREAAGHIVSPVRKQRADKEWDQGMKYLGLSANPLGPLSPSRAPPPDGSPASMNNQRQGTGAHTDFRGIAHIPTTQPAKTSLLM